MNPSKRNHHQQGDDEREATLRARGWSMHSEGTAGTVELTDAEKIASLQAIPSDLTNDYHHDDEEEPRNKVWVSFEKDTPSNTVNSNNNNSNNNNSNNNKRPRTPQHEGALVQHAKARLSKWAARLFDPNRPRGIIEPPQTIPLNDEFLQAFGKREKQHDQALGKELEIDHHIQDDDHDHDDHDSIGADEDAKQPSSGSAANTTGNKKEKRKVKISNLSFTTTQASLQAACEKFGAIETINMPMESDTRNKGRAYVTFESPSAAATCQKEFSWFDGRPLSVSFAKEFSTASSGGASAGTGGRARYWTQDISTKCFRCGQVGHMGKDCTNARLAKPCPFCAETDHDLRACPLKQVCFNCGVPGHVSRECRRPRGLPARRLEMPTVGRQEAICMSCHRPGHYLCRDFKWFFGLQGGLTCCNCGARGHVVRDCDRPNLDSCSRDASIAEQEIARASTFPTEDDLVNQQGRGRDRGRQDTNNRSQGQSRSRDQSRGPNRNNTSNRGRDQSRAPNSKNDRGRDQSRGPNNNKNNKNKGRDQNRSRRNQNNGDPRRRAKSAPPAKRRRGS